MLFGALVTIVYGLGVLYARRHSARDMDDFEDHIMGRKREEQAVKSRVSNGDVYKRQTEIFQYKGGIIDFVGYMNEGKVIINEKPVYFEAESEAGEVEISMQWTETYSENVRSFANNIDTTDGGTHLEGFRTALTKTINEYARKKNLLKEKDENLSGAVSYTHLDVYKRQVLSQASFQR